MTLKKAWNTLRTVVVVTIVTLLIWLYAEGENVKQYVVEADVQFVAPEGRKLEINPDQPRKVRITMRCASAKYTEADRLFRAGPVRIVLRDDPSSPVSHQAVALKDWMATHPPLSNLGVNLLEVQPASLDVVVEAWEKTPLEVVVVSDGVLLAGPPTVEPKVVTVELPATLAAAVKGSRFEARLDPKIMGSLEVNVPHTLDVDLTMPAALKEANLPLQPPRAKVTLKIRKQTDTVTVPLISVYLLSPPAESARFSVVLSPDNSFLRDVKLTGPSDIIDRIRRAQDATGDDQIKPWAYIRLTADDLEKGVGKESLTATPVISLPPGVTPLEPPQPVTFWIMKKE